MIENSILIAPHKKQLEKGFNLISTSPYAPQRQSAMAVYKDLIYIFSGYNTNQTISYDKVKGIWSNNYSVTAYGYSYPISASLTNNKIYLFFPSNGLSPVKAKLVIYDPVINIVAFNKDIYENNATSAWASSDGSYLYAIGNAYNTGDYNFRKIDLNGNLVSSKNYLYLSSLNYATQDFYNGFIYNYGGYPVSGQVDHSGVLSKIDITNGQYTVLGTNAIVRVSGSAILKNILYIFGGRDINNKDTNFLLRYDLVNNVWLENGVLPLTISYTSCVATEDAIFFYGGFVNGVMSSSLYAYVP